MAQRWVEFLQLTNKNFREKPDYLVNEKKVIFFYLFPLGKQQFQINSLLLLLKFHANGYNKKLKAYWLNKINRKLRNFFLHEKKKGLKQKKKSLKIFSRANNVYYLILQII